MGSHTHLSINFLRNKSDSLIGQITGNIDILMVSETKLDESFPIGQFIIEGFGVPYRVDQNTNGRGIMVFVREGNPSKLLSVENSPTEAFFVEINLGKKKWLLSCSYNPNRENIENHLETLSKSVALYSSSYENLIINGDFNVCVEEICMSGFCDTSGLKSLIKDATCYKNPENPSRIDPILTNNPRSFQNSCVIETGLSDFHRMVVTVVKTSFERLKPRVINYRDYKVFENQLFREDLLYELSKTTLEENADGFQEFIEICQKTLNHNAPTEQKLVRVNHLLLMNKTISKAIMHRTRFRNKYLGNKTDENKKSI